MIQGECPVCRRQFKVDDRYAGMTGRCKSCGAVIHVPGQPDEGLDGLPAAPAPQPNPAEATPSETAPGPAPSQQAADPRHRGAHPADELGRPRDVRSRYEPDHGPTALEGSWLKPPGQDEVSRSIHEPAPAEPPAEPAPEEPAARAPAPTPRQMLSGRVITPLAAEPAPWEHRPRLVTAAAGVVALLGIGFAAHFASAGAAGLVASCLGLALAGLAAVRMWRAHWDGLAAGALLCLCVGGGGLLPSAVPLAGQVLSGAAGVGLALLVLIVLRRAWRDYFVT